MLFVGVWYPLSCSLVVSVFQGEKMDCADVWWSVKECWVMSSWQLKNLCVGFFCEIQSKCFGHLVRCVLWVDDLEGGRQEEQKPLQPIVGPGQPGQTNLTPMDKEVYEEMNKEVVDKEVVDSLLRPIVGPGQLGQTNLTPSILGSRRRHKAAPVAENLKSHKRKKHKDGRRWPAWRSFDFHNFRGLLWRIRV